MRVKLLLKLRYNKRIHTDKIKLRRSAMQLYFTGDAWRYVTGCKLIKLDFPHSQCDHRDFRYRIESQEVKA